MSSKLSVAAAVVAHYNTLRNDVTGSMHMPDLVMFIGIPVALGAAVGAAGVRLSDTSSYLGGLAVFTGLLFGLVIFVFQLRLQLQERDDAVRSASQEQLISQLFYNVNYAVIVGILATMISVVATNLESDTGAPVWISVALVTLGAHLFLTVLMCIKRIHAAFQTVIHERSRRH